MNDPTTAPEELLSRLIEDLDELATDLNYEGNCEMSQEKQSRAALIYRGVKALRAANPPSGIPQEGVQAAKVTPTARALEWAEYLAKDAERFIEAFNAEGALRLRREESDDVDDDTMHDAEADISQYLRALRSGIYEFRKRAARVAPGAAVFTQQAKDVGDAE